MARRYQDSYHGDWSPHVSQAERRSQAEAFAGKQAKLGRPLSPVVFEGRIIGRSHWGRAWCRNFESLRDHANRLERGKTYVRNGSVIDLRIEAGRIEAWVSGSKIYRVVVEVEELHPTQRALLVRSCRECVRSALELLQGRIDTALMEVLAHPREGLFPRAGEIRMTCSCPDSARLCKHLAAVLYGVAARLDQQSELLFRLRGLDPQELVADAAEKAAGEVLARSGARRLEGYGELGELFGIEIDVGEDAEPNPVAGPSLSRRSAPVEQIVEPLPRRLPRCLGSVELLSWGVPRSTFQNWLRAGILDTTGTRGVYRITRRTRARILEVRAGRGID